MKAYLDIENSKTQEVITILLPVLEFEENVHIIFDISKVIWINLHRSCPPKPEKRTTYESHNIHMFKRV